MWRTATLWWTFLLVNKAYFSKQAQSLKKKSLLPSFVVIINEVQVELVLVLWLIALINCLAKNVCLFKKWFSIVKEKNNFSSWLETLLSWKVKENLKNIFLMNLMTFTSREPVCFVSWKNSNPSSISLLSPLLLPKGWLPKAILEEWKTTDVFTFLPHWNFKIHSYFPLLTYPWSSCWW